MTHTFSTILGVIWVFCSYKAYTRIRTSYAYHKAARLAEGYPTAAVWNWTAGDRLLAITISVFGPLSMLIAYAVWDVSDSSKEVSW